MTNKIILGVIAAIVLVVVILGLTLVGTYNTLVTLDQDTQAKWGQVQNVYQRRADLVPNLVNTVKGAANFEQQTLTAVTQARAQVGQVTSGAIENIARDPQAFERFQRERLANAVQKAGITTQPKVQFFPAHNIYAPNAEAIRKAGASSLPVNA